MIVNMQFDPREEALAAVILSLLRDCPNRKAQARVYAREYVRCRRYGYDAVHSYIHTERLLGTISMDDYFRPNTEQKATINAAYALIYG